MLLPGQSARKKKKKKKGQNAQNVYIIWIQQKCRDEIWNLISNKRSSNFKTLRLLCEFLQRRFYLAKHINKKFILSHSVFPVIISSSLGTRSVHMAVAVGSVFFLFFFHSGGSITDMFRYLQTNVQSCCNLLSKLLCTVFLVTFKNSVRYLNIQNMDQRLAWVILKTKRKNRKEGQELSKNF